jgi:membrane protein
VLYLPGTIERAAELYGLIGVTFTFVSWLFVTALVIIAAAIVGAEAAAGPTQVARPHADGVD